MIMDQAEITWLIQLLVQCSWVKTVHSFDAGEIIVQTTDEQLWTITSPLAYVRLVYQYECPESEEV